MVLTNFEYEMATSSQIMSCTFRRQRSTAILTNGAISTGVHLSTRSASH